MGGFSGCIIRQISVIVSLRSLLLLHGWKLLSMKRMRKLMNVYEKNDIIEAMMGHQLN